LFLGLFIHYLFIFVFIYLFIRVLPYVRLCIKPR
jgi:hypothetical protein